MNMPLNIHLSDKQRRADIAVITDQAGAIVNQLTPQMQDFLAKPIDEQPQLTAEQASRAIHICREALMPIGDPLCPDIANLLVRLTGPRFKASLENVDVWTSEVAAYLAELPLDIAQETAKQVNRRLKFFPTLAEIVEIGDALVAARRVLLARAETQLRRSRQQQAEQAAQARIDAQDPAEKRLIRLGLALITNPSSLTAPEREEAEAYRDAILAKRRPKSP